MSFWDTGLASVVTLVGTIVAIGATFIVIQLVLFSSLEFLGHFCERRWRKSKENSGSTL